MVFAVLVFDVLVLTFGVVGSVFVADVEGIVGVSFAVTVFVYLHF